MSQPQSVETRLFKLLAVIAAAAVCGVLALLPYRLYSRDIRHAEVQAHRVASVAHTALSQAVGRGEDVTDLANRFQGIADFEIRLRKLAEGDHTAVPGMVRMSLGVYNTEEDVDVFAEAMRCTLADGPRANYVVDDLHAGYVPEPLAFDLSRHAPF